MNSEPGHAPNRVYVSQDGNLHLNGAGIYTDETGTLVTGSDLQVTDSGSRMVPAGATLAITQALHDGKVILLNQLAGCVCTLPPATGSGMRVKFLQSVVPTSNANIIQVANSSDTLAGVIMTESDDSPPTMKGFTASGTGGGGSDTITLNRTTTGGTAIGEWIEVIDIAANLWSVTGVTASTGTEATPF